VLAACGDGVSRSAPVEPLDDSGRLAARVVTPTGTVPVGLSVQHTPAGRPFGLYVPSTYDPQRQWPVTVLLHGAGGSGEGMALTFKDFAEAAGVIVLAPNSSAYTWDRLLGEDAEYGPDIVHINQVLEWGFARIAADPALVSMSGFSDGATYTILIGLKNGDLFSRVAAFTPCAAVPGNRQGMPLIFISHGLDDLVLPIDNCSRVTVPLLQQRGYNVEFVEYPSAQGNGHFVTTEVLTRGMNWLAGR
jgi:phospholipase/carboxylesterase